MPRNRFLKAAAAALAAVAALAACGDGTVYDRYKPVDGWERADTATFHVRPAKAAGTYRTDVGLRTNAQYPFTGICIIVDRRILPADTRRSDTLYCRLTDKRGKPLGHGLSNYQYQFSAPACQLQEGDSLIVSVRHNMKRETLPGIEDIGLKMTRE